MSIGPLLILSGALGADALALSLGLGLGGLSRRLAAYLVVLVVVMHILFPMMGWWVGEMTGRAIGQYASYLGAAVLCYLGVRMLWEAFTPDQQTHPYLYSFWGLPLLAASISLDALSVGFSLGIVGSSLLVTAVTIGLVAGIMTAAGFILAQHLQERVGRKALILGGLALIGVGIYLVL